MTSEAEAALEEARTHLAAVGDGLAAVLVLLDAVELLRDRVSGIAAESPQGASGARGDWSGAPRAQHEETPNR